MTRSELLITLGISFSVLFGLEAIVGWGTGDVSVGVLLTLIALPQIFALAALIRHMYKRPLSDASLRDVVKAIVSATLLCCIGVVAYVFRNKAFGAYGILKALFGLAAFTSFRDTLTVLLMPRDPYETSNSMKLAAIKRHAQWLPDWESPAAKNPGD